MVTVNTTGWWLEPILRANGTRAWRVMTNRNRHVASVSISPYDGKLGFDFHTHDMWSLRIEQVEALMRGAHEC